MNWYDQMEIYKILKKINKRSKKLYKSKSIKYNQFYLLFEDK